jgi:arylsulfatase A-like enzyme
LLPTVQTIDLMPTVLELAGLDEPPGLQGQSLVPLIQAASRGEEQSWPRPAITEKAAGLVAPRMPNSDTEYTALISDGWKLIRHIPPTESVGEYELFNHREDPLNMVNVAADNPEKVQELAGQLMRWEEGAIAVRLEEGELDQNMDPAELERLRSLGYIN